jgi:hypothetical protein
MVRDSDFAKAIVGQADSAAQNPAQSTPDNAGQTRTSENAGSEKLPKKQGNPALCAVGGDERYGRGWIRTNEGRAIRFTV